MKMIRNIFFKQVTENFEIWGCLLRIDVKLCCTKHSWKLSGWEYFYYLSTI